MGVAKVTLNGETLIDVTDKTVASDKMLASYTALNKAGNEVTGNIATQSVTNVTASGSTVTIPAGFYSTQITKDVDAGSAFAPAVTITTNPSVTISTTTGLVTATYSGSSSITPTVTSGYVSTGTAGTVSTSGTGTLQLSTQAAQTINTSTADQTIASYRWLTGTQTIKSVTTSNITASNIKSGVTVKVGDANNASRITQVTGTLKEGTPHTATISGTGNSTNCYVQHNGIKYYTDGNTFTFYDNDVIDFYAKGTTNSSIEFGYGVYAINTSGQAVTYSYTAIGCDIVINMEYQQPNSIADIYVIFSNSDNTDYRSELKLGANQVVTPTKSAQYIYPPSSCYGLGTITVQGDSNLISGNIKSGLSIFGVQGNYTGEEFIITLTYQFDEDLGYVWVPDKTSTQIQQAYSAGKSIRVQADVTSYSTITGIVPDYITTGGYYHSTYGDLEYTVDLPTADGYNSTNYSFQNDNLAIRDDLDYYNVESTSVSYTPTESVQTDTLTPGSGYGGFSTVSVTVNAISSTYVGTGVTQRHASDLTANLSTVTVPAGYYSSQVTKNVASATAFKPAVTITSSSGVVTATNTFTSAYYASSTTTSTLNLTTQAAQTINTSTADQTIASYRWLTGTQTIKSVTTSNILADNIRSGVTVKVGDANNASRITQVVGTYAGTAINNQNKSFTPDETGASITADAGYTGLGTVTVAGISSTYVGTGIARKSSADLTANLSTVTVPAGYYSSQVTKNVSSQTAFAPAVTITSSTGVVTGTNTFTSAYYAASTKTSTVNLTTQAAQTINTSTADQTIASYRWLTGTQTIKSVTTTNLTAANIAEGVTVKVGDANNASRITQVVGTHSGATSYTATISGSGNSSYCYVTYNGTKYYTNGNTFTYKAGDTLTIYCRGNNLTINGDATTLSSYSYTYTLPVGDITINLSYSSSTSNNIKVWGLVQPTGTYTISASGTHNIYKYSAASVAAGSAFPPATTITTNPTVTIASTTGVVTATYTGSSSITPTVTSGYISQGTAGTISTTGTNTLNLTTQAAQTINTSTADQTIASYRWLTGTQTIKSVTTSNLIADNIKSGVTIKVGDTNNASRITQIVGTYAGTVINNQNKSFTPDETGATLSADAGYTGLGTVTVAGISSTYVGTGIARKSAADLTASYSTVTVPVGYYSSQVTKNVASATAFAPAVTITSSTGVITGTNTFTSAYYAASTKTSTINLNTQAATTITPTETVQRAVSSYYWTTGHISVAAISNTYVGTGVARLTSADIVGTIYSSVISLASWEFHNKVSVPAGYFSTITSAIDVFPEATFGTQGIIKFDDTGNLGIAFLPSTNGVVYEGLPFYSLSTSVPWVVASTYTPGAVSQVISSGQYLRGSQTIAGDLNLLAQNIKSGISIFGVQGTYVGTVVTYTVDEDDKNLIVSKQEGADIPNGNAESF